MHISSMKRMGWFIKNYIEPCSGNIKVLDVGSYCVNGSYKDLLNNYSNVEYFGLDIEPGPNVDVVVSDIYDWKELEDDSFDFIISGQAFEHIEYPWLTIRQIKSKLKMGGVTCIIVPSTIEEHRYPKDCYRYYGDGLNALAKWAGLKTIETAIAGVPNLAVDGAWDDRSNDAILIARKDNSLLSENDSKIIFNSERRYVPIFDLKMQYEFLSLMYRSDACRYIKKYIEDKKFSKVYLLGNGHITEYIADYLGYDSIIKIKSNGIMANVDGGSVVDFTTRIYNEKMPNDVDSNSIFIITEFDYNRNYREYVKRCFGLETVFYAYDLVDFLAVRELSKASKDIYIYGAGKFGKIIYERLIKLGINVKGFVVSNGKKNLEEYLGKKVFELKNVETSAGIIVGIENGKEIFDILKGEKYFNCINGMDLISTWMYSIDSVN